MKFSTFDVDNDRSGLNCANNFGNGGWWHNDCHSGALTGKYYSEEEVKADRVKFGTGITFKCLNSKGHNYSVKFVEAKLLI